MNVEDERAIMAVLLRYATAIDTRDWPLLADCFVADFAADYDGIAKWTSRDAFVDYMAKGHERFGQTLHRVTNMVIAADAKSATSRCYVDAMLMPLEQGGPILRAEGYYDDTLVRDEDGWKIASRHFVSVLMGEEQRS